MLTSIVVIVIVIVFVFAAVVVVVIAITFVKTFTEGVFERIIFKSRLQPTKALRISLLSEQVGSVCIFNQKVEEKNNLPRNGKSTVH